MCAVGDRFPPSKKRQEWKKKKKRQGQLTDIACYRRVDPITDNLDGATETRGFRISYEVIMNRTDNDACLSKRRVTPHGSYPSVTAMSNAAENWCTFSLYVCNRAELRVNTRSRIEEKPSDHIMKKIRY